jgi:hypothetical protein
LPDDDHAARRERDGEDGQRVVLLRRGVSGYLCRLHPNTTNWSARQIKNHIARLNRELGVAPSQVRSLQALWDKARS